MIVSSGGVCHQYEVIGSVVGFASKAEGVGGGIDVEQVYQMALKRLAEAAKGKGASGPFQPISPAPTDYRPTIAERRSNPNE